MITLLAFIGQSSVCCALLRTPLAWLLPAGRCLQHPALEPVQKEPEVSVQETESNPTTSDES